MSNKFQIRVHSGTLRGQAFIINKPEFKIGRDPSCDIVLTENAVSRVHLLIYSQDFNNIVLVDNNSTNGTTVNNVAVTAPVQVFENDVIMLGGEVALALESAPEIQNPYAPYSQPVAPSVPSQGYGMPSNIPSYQPPVAQGAPNYPGASGNMGERPVSNPNLYSNEPLDPNKNQLEEKNMANSQNPSANNLNNEPGPGSFSQPAYGGSQPPYPGQPEYQNNPGNFNQQPYPGQQYPDPRNPYSQYPSQQQQPYSGFPNQAYSQPGAPYQQPQVPNQFQGTSGMNAEMPYGAGQNPASQYPSPQQGAAFQNAGFDPAAQGGSQNPQSQYPQYPNAAGFDPQFGSQQNPQAQFYGQSWPAAQNPYGGQPYGQQPVDPAMQQQPWQNQPYPQQPQGYPYNPQQPGYGQQNPQAYGGYAGYPQDYSNLGYPQEEVQADEEANKRKRLYIILGAVLLFIIALIVFIIIIDSNYLWCDVFPFLWSPEACAIYTQP